jgi:signal transduction histidine kinase
METIIPWYNRTLLRGAVALCFGFLGWIVYCCVEAFIYPTKPFLQLILTNIPISDLFFRIIVSGCFFLFGIIVVNIIAEQKTREKKLRDTTLTLQQQNNKLQRQIQEKNSEIDCLLRQKNDLLIGLSHDLNTPLTPLMGFLPMIIREEQDPKLKELLTISLKNVHFIRDLVSKAIDLSLLDSTVIGLSIEKTNLLSEVETVLDNRYITLQNNHINVDNTIDEHLFVQADKIKLREILNNLLTNSITYSSPTGGTITIDAKRKQNEVIVSVTDTGIGLTQEQQDRIFDELYKGDAARQDHKKTGLGLPICKRIVEKHGGKIWAESPGPGKGTTVFFTLPAGNEK